ncbi:hypothetical protein JHK87_010400 [Glycine soja]|nr:hypothetical protein JHK87_010400 [Glycine soja]
MRTLQRQLTTCNFGVYAMDWIGHGGSDGLHGYVPSLDHVVVDTIRHVRKKTSFNILAKLCWLVLSPLTHGWSINWMKHLEIAEDFTKGIEYLHMGCVHPVIHRDLKNNNILLDKQMRAKVSDFGLSKLAVDGASHVSRIVRGTVGYLDPNNSDRDANGGCGGSSDIGNGDGCVSNADGVDDDGGHGISVDGDSRGGICGSSDDNDGDGDNDGGDGGDLVVVVVVVALVVVVIVVVIWWLGGGGDYGDSDGGGDSEDLGSSDDDSDSNSER